MSFCKILTDPLQNRILLDEGIAASGRRERKSTLLDEAEEVILHPTYMINGGDEGIYYFKHIGEDTNILVEARLEDELVVVTAMVVNPTVDYISRLLKTGNLIHFPPN